MRRSARLLPVKVEGGVVIKQEPKEMKELISMRIKKEKKEEDSDDDFVSTRHPKRKRQIKLKKEKIEDQEVKVETKEEEIEDGETKSKKIKVKITTKGSPFPSFSHPSQEECRRVCSALAQLHGMPRRPPASSTSESAAAGCGEVPNVIQAIIRTILRYPSLSLSFLLSLPLPYLTLHQIYF
jgi:hypothetical protein